MNQVVSCQIQETSLLRNVIGAAENIRGKLTPDIFISSEL